MFSHLSVRALSRASLLAVLCSAASVVASAQSTGTSTLSSPQAEPFGALQPVEISFALHADGKTVQCGTPFSEAGASAVKATLRDARFYLQDLALVDSKGQRTLVKLTPSDWQNDQVTLIDFEDATGACEGGTPATNTLVKGTVPAGQYSGLAFTVGVPVSQNHTSTELEGAPLDLAAMGWSWQAGRKFIKMEVNPQGGVTKADGSHSPTWFVHLGSTGCTGNPVTGETVSCKRPNRLPVVLESFDVTKHHVVLDLASLLNASDVSRDNGGAVGCMSNPADQECVAIFERLGLSLETGTSLKPGVSPVFSTGMKP